jgi:hypothetical protein
MQCMPTGQRARHGRGRRERERGARARGWGWGCSRLFFFFFLHPTPPRPPPPRPPARPTAAPHRHRHPHPDRHHARHARQRGRRRRPGKSGAARACRAITPSRSAPGLRRRQDGPRQVVAHHGAQGAQVDHGRLPCGDRGGFGGRRLPPARAGFPSTAASSLVHRQVPPQRGAQEGGRADGGHGDGRRSGGGANGRHGQAGRPVPRPRQQFPEVGEQAAGGRLEGGVQLERVGLGRAKKVR